MNSSESGNFILSAINSEINYMDGIHRSDLVGYPEGRLEWNNTSLSDIAVKAKQITSYGYISFNCGLILQWSETEWVLYPDIMNRTRYFSIAFPTPCIYVFSTVYTLDSYDVTSVIQTYTQEYITVYFNGNVKAGSNTRAFIFAIGI